MTGGPLLFLVAGEPSGDALGAALMRALAAETGGAARFMGVGGPAMAAEGLASLVPQADLAVMGLVEVLPRLRRLLGHIRTVAEACRAARPAALVTIDSPSFGLRVAKAVRAADPSIRVIHYVAPQVWAWRPGRARKLAGVVDHLLALLPFEPAYFTPYGLTCDVVGHPIAAAPRASAAEAAAFRAAHGIAADAPLLAALPGSRMGEVRRHAAPFGAAIAALGTRLPGLRVVVPTVAGVADALAARIADWPGRPVLVDPRGLDAAAADAAKRAAFAAADAALAASGTVTLELAAAGLPMVAAYKTHPLTALVVRFLLEVDTVVLVNLVAGEKAVPEFLQEHFRPEAVADALAPLFTDGPERTRQLDAFARAMTALGAGGEDPARRAARSVLAALRAPRPAARG